MSCDERSEKNGKEATFRNEYRLTILVGVVTYFSYFVRMNRPALGDEVYLSTLQIFKRS